MTAIPLAPRPLLAVAGFLALAATALAADAEITLSRTPDGKTPVPAPVLRPNG